MNKRTIGCVLDDPPSMKMNVLLVDSDVVTEHNRYQNYDNDDVNISLSGGCCVMIQDARCVTSDTSTMRAGGTEMWVHNDSRRTIEKIDVRKTCLWRSKLVKGGSPSKSNTPLFHPSIRYHRHDKSTLFPIF